MAGEKLVHLLGVCRLYPSAMLSLMIRWRFMASPMAIQLSRSMAYYYFSFNMRLMVVQFLDNLEHQQWGQRIEEKVGGCNFRAGTK